MQSHNIQAGAQKCVQGKPKNQSQVHFFLDARKHHNLKIYKSSVLPLEFADIFVGKT